MTAGASSAIAEVGEDMPGVRKVAVLLMSLDTDRAAKLIRELDPDDVAAVAVELEQMQHLGGTTIDTVIEDFARTAAEQRRDVRGGRGFHGVTLTSTAAASRRCRTSRRGSQGPARGRD